MRDWKEIQEEIDQHEKAIEKLMVEKRDALTTIKEGDYVINSAGKKAKVTKVMASKYGKMVRIFGHKIKKDGGLFAYESELWGFEEWIPEKE